MSYTVSVAAALDRAGYRQTAPRRKVAELIAAHDGHFTAADLLESAQRRRLHIGRATIFRALDLFASLSVVERVDLPDGGHAYVGCDPIHHHHVICTSCGRSIEVEDCGMSDVVREVGNRSGFRVDAHRLELFGVCRDCQRAEPH